MGDADWKYAYASEPNVILVRDGDSWKVGAIKVDVLHTPGHTPEHISFMITDTAGADKPMGVFTGDFLFVGDVGRPDLLKRPPATRGQGGRRPPAIPHRGALPDAARLSANLAWPQQASACGKALESDSVDDAGL